MKVHGCRGYYNRLLEKVGLPIVGECTVSGSIAERRDLGLAARAAWHHFTRASGLEGSIAYSGSETIGRRYTVNRYTVSARGIPVGELRIVHDTEGTLLNASIALSGDIAKLSRVEVGPGWSVEEGWNMGPTLLDPGGVGEWPRGQKAIPRFVVYAVEGIPRVDPGSWRLKVEGRLGSLELGLEDLARESRQLGEMDFHCVTGWSVRGRRWRGLPLLSLLEKVDPMDGGWVVFHSVNGYSTVVPMDYATRGLVVIGIDGAPLSPDNGFPARFFNPELFGWKSAKWLSRIEVVDHYIDGVWEALAYHERGLVAADERFKIRNPDLA
ncbi:MAG: molybdopterin-dependent oxidoreductase [Desulfurococcales archaeon]|nr:molybdopterin-dependent oxidoreductase [Desulfurococcales archaeon]